MFSESDLHNPSLDAQVAAAVAYQNIRDHGLMRRPPYHLHHHHDVANPPFYQFEDVPLPCSAAVFDHCGIVEPAAAAAYLYNPTSMVYDYGSSCPDCCDRELALSDTAKSSGDDATCPGRRPTRKRSLSQAELERRRSLANHQERRRMHRLNSALDRLRSAIPLRLQSGGGGSGASNSSSPSSRRLSKIKTLKMAISYIGELQTVLGVAAAGSGRCWN